MLKIVVEWVSFVFCLILMFAEPSFSQAPRPRGLAPPVSPAQQLTPSLQQPVPWPNATPFVLAQQSSSPRPDAQPSPAAPGQPADTTQQTVPARPGASQSQPTPAQRGKVVSRHRETKPRHHEGAAGRVDKTYVTAWSGPYVIERAHDYAAFVVEGSWYRARTFCPGWVAGERVSLRAGPPGWCALVNRTRHRTCLVSCVGRPGWRPYL
jgi:hypothetical protein